MALCHHLVNFNLKITDKFMSHQTSNAPNYWTSVMFNSHHLICFDRNEIIPKLKEYNMFFEGRKALQLTSKEVRMAFEYYNVWYHLM